jgi:lipopolysaccharide export system permease protein
MLKIWEKYLLQSIIRVIFLFIICFYLLYIAVDYSLNIKMFEGASIMQIATYYSYHFFKRMPIILPFALLLSTIKTLCFCNVNNELLVLNIAGISKKKLMKPFCIIACLSMLFIYANYQFMQPYILRCMDNLYLDKYVQRDSEIRLHSFQLQDNSTIIYQKYNSVHNFFFDVFWIRSNDEIIHMKYLYPTDEGARGLFVDRLIRIDTKFTKTDSYEETNFVDIPMAAMLNLPVNIAPEHKSISQLYRDIQNRYYYKNYNSIATWFWYKMFVPWICILAAIGPASYCLRIDRNVSVFALYSIGLLLTVTLFTIVNAMKIFAENGICSPFFALLVPMVSFFAFFSWKSLKI